ncbi:hypothetical protein Tco_0909802 [Tanacetum coccineum]|uniref:Uncharacterized protein n=1 Tax=Tanacetum coccineum TaxID=301880 RepID=A0ABQ5CSX9_9ASTR
MSRSPMTISLVLDDESVDLSTSYILLLDTKTEPVETPPSPDYVSALDTDTELLEAPASPNYTPRSNTESEPSEIDSEEPEEDPSEEDLMEDDEPLPTQNALTPRIQPSIIRNALLEIVAPPDERYRSPFLSSPSPSPPPSPSSKICISPSLPPSPPVPASPPSDMSPPRKRSKMTSPHPNTTDEAIPTRLCRMVEAHRWVFVIDRICTWRYQEGEPSAFKLDESSSIAHVISVIVEPVHYTIPLLVVRLVRHKDRIKRIQDNLKELPVEKVEFMEQEIKTLQVRVEAAKQRSEVLQDSLKIARDMITELQIRVKDVEARL